MKTCTYCGKENEEQASVCVLDGQPLQSVAAAQPQPVVEEKYSVLGLASFAMSIAVGGLMFLLFIVAGLLNSGRVEHGQTYPGQVIVGLVVMLLLAVDLVAVGLGIAGLCQAGKNRIFGILGLVFSSGTILGTICLIFVGLTYTAKLPR